MLGFVLSLLVSISIFAIPLYVVSGSTMLDHYIHQFTDDVHKIKEYAFLLALGILSIRFDVIFMHIEKQLNMLISERVPNKIPLPSIKPKRQHKFVPMAHEMKMSDLSEEERLLHEDYRRRYKGGIFPPPI